MPRRKHTPMTVDELRTHVLGFDGMVEASHHGKADFRFAGKIVVNLDESERSITIKLNMAEQAALVAVKHPAVTLPGGWAKHGWTTIHLDTADPTEVREWVADAVDTHRKPTPTR